MVEYIQRSVFEEDSYVNVDTVQRFFREKFKDFSFEDEKISR